jgi:hypothetical protein
MDNPGSSTCYRAPIFATTYSDHRHSSPRIVVGFHHIAERLAVDIAYSNFKHRTTVHRDRRHGHAGSPGNTRPGKAAFAATRHRPGDWQIPAPCPGNR